MRDADFGDWCFGVRVPDAVPADVVREGHGRARRSDGGSSRDAAPLRAEKDRSVEGARLGGRDDGARGRERPTHASGHRVAVTGPQPAPDGDARRPHGVSWCESTHWLGVPFVK